MIVFFMCTVSRLMEIHGEGGTTTTVGAKVVSDSGEKVMRPEGYEPPVMDQV